jgi:hypothetical protein
VIRASRRRGGNSDPYGDDDPYQDRRTYAPGQNPYTPKAPTTSGTGTRIVGSSSMPPTRPMPTTPITRQPPPIDFNAGTGSPGGYTTGGVFTPYSYGPTDGKYGGFDTVGGLNDAIIGDTETWLSELAAQADAIEAAYAEAMGGIGQRVQGGYNEAFDATRDNMRRYGDSRDRFADQVYNRPAPRLTSITVNGRKIDIDPKLAAGIARQESSIPVYDGDARVYRPAPAANPGEDFAAPDNLVGHTQDGRPIARVVNFQLPAGEGDEYGKSFYHLISPELARSVAVQSGSGGGRIETPNYDPTYDYEQAREAAGVNPYYNDVYRWGEGARASEEARWKPSLEQVAELDATPDNVFAQAIARNRYGVNDSVAAGMFDETWNRNRELEAIADANAYDSEMRDRESWDEYGMPYSEQDDDEMSAAQILAERRAQRDLDTWDRAVDAGLPGMTYNEAVAAEARAGKDAETAKLDVLSQAFGADARAILQSANLTTEQAEMALFDEQGNPSQDFDEALSALQSALDDGGGGLDEGMARDVLIAAYETDPAIAKLLAALYPELTPSDYLVP